MIKSMTGYGKAEVEIQDTVFSIEIRTLNSKQIDINMRVPQPFKEKEIGLRAILSKNLQRGKVDFGIFSDKQNQSNNIKLNKETAIKYYQEIKNLAEEVGEETKDILSLVTRLPEVFSSEEEAMDAGDWECLQNAVEEAIEKVNIFRSGEGAILEKDFRSRTDNILKLLEQVPTYESARIDRIRERIQKSMDENFSNVQYDKNRMEQEIIFYIEKLDITEEKIRLKKHSDYFLEVLDSEDTVGKKLAFVLQEMGREINTLGSKANDASLQKLVVLMKDELEKIKEQMLNIL